MNLKFALKHNIAVLVSIIQDFKTNNKPSEYTEEQIKIHESKKTNLEGLLARISDSEEQRLWIVVETLPFTNCCENGNLEKVSTYFTSEVKAKEYLKVLLDSGLTGYIDIDVVYN